MEVRGYLEILLRRWRLFLIGAVVTVAATMYFTLNQPRVYQAIATFIIVPNELQVIDDDFIRLLDTMSRRIEINNTFAEVANSKLIKQLATDRLDLTNEQRRSLSVNGRVLAGTNVLELTAKGNDPELARAFAEAVSQEIISYSSGLYDVFELEQLDQASASRRPISPNIQFNLGFGVVLGVGLGIALAFLSEYLQSPGMQPRFFDIIDPGTGVYNKAYFEMRLRQEISRTKRNSGTLSIAMIRINDHGAKDSSNSKMKAGVMPRIAALFGPLMRDEDLLARFDDTTFALLLPDMPGIAAQNAVEEARIRLGTTPMRIGEHTAYLNVHGVAGVVEWSVHDSGEDELMVRAVQALEAAEASTYGKIIFLAAPETAELQQPAALSIEIEEVEQALPVFWERGGLEKEPFPIGENEPRSNGGQHQTEVENAMEPVGEKRSPDERQEVGPLESEPKATRAAQKLAQEYGIDLKGIRGSGKDERIVKADIEKLI